MKVHVLTWLATSQPDEVVLGVYATSQAAHSAAEEQGIDAIDFDVEVWEVEE